MWVGGQELCKWTFFDSHQDLLRSTPCAPNWLTLVSWTMQKTPPKTSTIVYNHSV